MSKITIIPVDGFVAVDGVGYIGLVLDMVPSEIHAVQLNGGAGHVEFVEDAENVKPGNLATTADELPWLSGALEVWGAADYKAKNPEPFVPTPEQIAAAVTAARSAAYRAESDPLFFKAQRGESTQDEWLANVAEIKARYPDGVWPYAT